LTIFDSLNAAWVRRALSKSLKENYRPQMVDAHGSVLWLP